MTKRNSGIDMLRILSMMGIVSLHVIGLGEKSSFQMAHYLI